MTAIWMHLRADLRRDARRWGAVVLLVGLAGGLALASAIGARRTHTAFPRLLDHSRAHDVLLGPEGRGRGPFFDEIVRLPEVVAHAPIAGLNGELVRPSPPKGFLGGPMLAPLDHRLATTIERPNMLEGRPPTRADEVWVNKVFADDVAVGAGDRIEMKLLRYTASGQLPPLPVTFRITGVGVLPTQVLPITEFDRYPQVVLSEAAGRRWVRPDTTGFDALILRLREGADPAALRTKVERIQSRYASTAGRNLFFTDDSQHYPIVQDAIRPSVLAILVFGLAAGLALVVVAGQALTRVLSSLASDAERLRALGMTRGQLTGAALARVVLSAVVGSVVAVAIAIAASGLAPIGRARLAEVQPGREVNVSWLITGSVALVLAMVVVSIPGSVSVLRRGWRAARTRPSSASVVAAKLGARPSTVMGVRLGLEPGSGASAVPTRSTILTTVIVIVAIVATMVVGFTMDKAVASPRTFGQTWDIALDAQFGEIPRALVPTEGVRAASGGAYGALQIGGVLVPAIGLEPIHGAVVGPQTVRGRAPSREEEIVLGESTIRRLDVRLGSLVTTRSPLGEKRMRVVGSAVFPAMGIGSFTPTNLGDGAWVNMSVLPFTKPGAYSFVLLDGVANIGAVKKRFDADCFKITDVCSARLRQAPPIIAGLDAVRSTPRVLIALLFLVGIAIVMHAVVTAVRRRARDLALLKTFGFSRAQMHATVFWQASSILGVATVVAAPAGVVLGRWAWRVLADDIGILVGPAVPLALLAALLGVAFLAVNAIAAFPARGAALVQPARILRAE